jgi:hypothetical protein
MCLTHLLDQRSVRDLLGRWPLLARPSIEGAARDRDASTHQRDGVVGPLCQNQPEERFSSLAKKAAAFFRKSRSVSRRCLSRRSCSSSLRSAAFRAGAVAGAPPSVACLTHSRSAVSVRSSDPAGNSGHLGCGVCSCGEGVWGRVSLTQWGGAARSLPQDRQGEARRAGGDRGLLHPRLQHSDPVQRLV